MVCGSCETGVDATAVGIWPGVDGSVRSDSLIWVGGLASSGQGGSLAGAGGVCGSACVECDVVGIVFWTAPAGPCAGGGSVAAGGYHGECGGILAGGPSGGYAAGSVPVLDGFCDGVELCDLAAERGLGLRGIFTLSGWIDILELLDLEQQLAGVEGRGHNDQRGLCLL